LIDTLDTIGLNSFRNISERARTTTVTLVLIVSQARFRY
jgi:hypothetical protein